MSSLSRSCSGDGEPSSPGDDRGQTDPIAALVAVAAVCLAISLYAGHVAEAMPGTSDRSVEDATLERVWSEIGSGGAYDPSDGGLADLEPTALPDGYVVGVTVTIRDENGTDVVFDDAQFLPEERANGRSAPAESATTSRPIAVVYGPGDVRAGTLTVEVWR